MPSAVWSARCHSGWWACVKSVAGDVRQRRAAAATGRQLVPTASADLRWVGGCCSFVAARGDGGNRAGWLLIFAAPHVHPAALPGKPDPAICPALTNTPPAPLGLAPELQIHEICSVRRTRVVLDG